MKQGTKRKKEKGTKGNICEKEKEGKNRKKNLEQIVTGKA